MTNHTRRCSVAVVIAFALAIAGCGDTVEDSAPQAAAESEGKAPAPQPKPKPARKPSYRVQIAECVEDVGYSTRDAGNALRVESSTGANLKANVQVFKSKSEAQEFAAQLEVDGTYGGKAVAVWLKDAGDSDRAVIGDCLTP